MSMKSLQGRHTSVSRDERRTAWDGCRPLEQAHGLACRQLGNYIHHCHLLLSPKADTHFTIPQRVGWVDIDSCYIPRWFTCQRVDTHPSSNWVQCWLNTLIEASALTTTLRCHQRLIRCQSIIVLSTFVWIVIIENFSQCWWFINKKVSDL